MHSLRLRRVVLRGLLATTAGWCCAPLPVRAEDGEPVAVLAQTFNGYTHARLADGSFKPERYAFGEGGCWTRPVDDPVMEKLRFVDVARVVARPLQRLNYLPARRASEADLFILVFWGATQGTRGNDPELMTNQAAVAMADYNRLKPLPGETASTEATIAESAMDDILLQLAMANRERDRIDDRNARILGYTEALDRARFASHMTFAQDTFAEVGDNRYYVVLQAYDFPTALKYKRLKPLWTVRMSVREHGDFTKVIDQMIWSASRYFGQDSKGLHRYETVLESKVEIGPMEIMEVEPPPGQPGSGPEPAAAPGH